LFHLHLVYSVFSVKKDNMKKEEFEKIVEELGDLKSLPNNKLIEIMDTLTTEFELTKNNIIGLTLYLDKVEEFYNKSLDEYQSRTNGK
jgi:predicted ATP-grasp superfamily ATP-dependent carboligase